jgi:hypothetical protein
MTEMLFLWLLTNDLQVAGLWHLINYLTNVTKWLLVRLDSYKAIKPSKKL